MIQEHGGNTIEYQNILDFSANINPLGMPDTIQKTIIDNISSIENILTRSVHSFGKK